MSSVNDIMAVLLEAPPTKTTTIVASKPGRGRPATRGNNKQISSSITITSKPTNTITSKPTNSPTPSSKSAPSSQQQQQQQQQQKSNKPTNNKKQQAIGMLSPAQVSRLEQEFVKVL